MVAPPGSDHRKMDQNVWKRETSVKAVKQGSRTSRRMLLALTLIGLGVPGDQVLQLKAVGSHLLLRLAADSCHVAVLHLTGAAAGPGVDAHSQRLAWKAGGGQSHAHYHVFTQGRSKFKQILEHIMILKMKKKNLAYTFTHKQTQTHCWHSYGSFGGL